MNINKINHATLKIIDMRFADIDGAPKRCTLMKLYTNQGLVGYGIVNAFGRAMLPSSRSSVIVSNNL